MTQKFKKKLRRKFNLVSSVTRTFKMSGNLTNGYVVISSHDNSSLSTVLTDTTTDDGSKSGTESSSIPLNHLLAYILVPVGSLILVVILAIIVALIFRKSRLDKLRHHLMPLYSFDPADENGDWESELLENQEKEQEVALRIESRSPSPNGSPKLKFTANRRQV